MPQLLLALESQRMTDLQILLIGGGSFLFLLWLVWSLSQVGKALDEPITLTEAYAEAANPLRETLIECCACHTYRPREELTDSGECVYVCAGGCRTRPRLVQKESA